MTTQVIHPDVARAKFDAEVNAFTRDAAQYRRRGAYLVHVDFPTVTLMFATPKLTPAAVLFGVRVDYTNYDLQPPSVRFVHPFDDHDLTAAEMPTKLPRLESRPIPPEILQAVAAGQIPADQIAAENPGPGQQPQGVVSEMMLPVALVQDYGPESIPFLCLAGTREYHDHPGHSGDSWELHRTSGAGSLVRLANIVLTYGVEPAGGWSVTLAPQMTIGFGQPPQ
jgi:hypothetical protein